MIRGLLLCLALLASALIAGFFYAYQVSVMPGLADAPPLEAIAAMQGINRQVRTGLFAFSFFGTLAFGLAAALSWLPAWRSPVPALVWAGTAAYVIGAFAVTFLFNVPLNEGLAPIVPTAETAAATWAGFYGRWMTWNLVRTLASIAAFACFAAALWLQGREAGRRLGPDREPA